MELCSNPLPCIQLVLNVYLNNQVRLRSFVINLTQHKQERAWQRWWLYQVSRVLNQRMCLSMDSKQSSTREPTPVDWYWLPRALWEDWGHACLPRERMWCLISDVCHACRMGKGGHMLHSYFRRSGLRRPGISGPWNSFLPSFLICPIISILVTLITTQFCAHVWAWELSLVWLIHNRSTRNVSKYVYMHVSASDVNIFRTSLWLLRGTWQSLSVWSHSCPILLCTFVKINSYSISGIAGEEKALSA